MLVNAGQPHILILGAHSRRGRHNFNFNNHTVHLRYQMNPEGVTIELYPPVKKTQMDNTNSVSPYNHAPAKRPSIQTGPKKNLGKIAAIRNAQKSKKENTNPVDKPQSKKRAEKRKSSTLKKCAIQRIFNFSEAPTPIRNKFPYEGCCPANRDSQRITVKEEQSLKNDVRRAGFRMKSMRSGCNLRQTLSAPQNSPKLPSLPLHKNYSMTVVQTLHHMKRQQLKRVKWPNS